ncbi:hypothetical protein KC315_g6317 [Hortaea werneckii]|nr:hypothetical protein KC315_g6317 [Hortaea werneckii]KAI7364093.1 hypothetical protein KC354_g5970 [Hortaea werneckii]
MEPRVDDRDTSPDPLTAMSQMPNQGAPPIAVMIALDFGTTKSAGAFRIAHCNGPPRRQDIMEVQQANRMKTAPMIAAWLDGDFVCGHELQAMINQGRVAEDKVMRFFKLLLYDDWQESEGAHEIARLLNEAGKSREDLFVAVLKQMYLYAQRQVQIHARHKYDIDGKPRNVYLTVPKNASFSARQLLATSCQRAGLAQCILVSEPLCAAACNLQGLADGGTAAGLIGERIIVVDGGGGTVYRFEDNPPSISISLPWTTIRTFFETDFQKVLELIDLHYTDHTKSIVCTGGFGMSPYLQYCIKEVRPELRMLAPHGQDCYFPVCKGALLRFDVIDTTQLRSLYAFGVTQGEVFDREKHPDGVVGSTFVDTDRVRVEAGSIDLRVVKHDFLDPKLDVVEDRIQWLIKQDNAPGEDGWYVSRPLWQRGYPEVYGPRARKFSVSVVVTKRPPERLHDSAPLIDKVTGQIFPDLHILAEREVKLDLEQARRYNIVERQRGGKEFKCYQVWSTVVLRHNNESLQVGIAFAAPEDSPYDCDGNLKADVAIETLQMSAVHWPFPESQTHAIWDHRYDPHVHDMIGSTVRQDDDVTARVQPQQPPRRPAPNHVEGSQAVPGPVEADPYRRSPTLGPETLLQHVEDGEHAPGVTNPSGRAPSRPRNNMTFDANRSRGMTARRGRNNRWPRNR